MRFVPTLAKQAALLRAPKNFAPVVPVRYSAPGNFWGSKNFQNLQGQWQESMKHSKEGEELWKKVTLFLCLPTCFGFALYCIKHEMSEHHKPRQEFIPYEHLRRRNVKLPWGDGNHTLFHNPVKNALPDGYEVPDPNAGNEHHHH